MAKRTSESEAIRIMKRAGFQPLEPYRNSDTPWKSLCQKCKRQVKPRFRKVRDRGSGCRFCTGKEIPEEIAVQEFSTANLKPLVPFPGASKKWKSKCLTCHEIVSPRLSDIRIGRSGCKKCSDLSGGKKRRLANNPKRAGKESKFEEVLEIMRKAKLEPLEPYETSQTKWKCKCLNCGAIVSPKYNQIKQGRGGCRDCFLKRQPLIKRLDQDKAFAVMQSKNLQPLESYPGAMKPWKCKCLDCGTVIMPRYAHIQQGRKGCKVCGYRKNATNSRTSESTATSIMIDAGFKPLEPYKNRHHPWRSQCQKCGNVISPRLGSIIIGQGCRFCSGLVVDPEDAKKKMIAADLDPLTEYPGAGKPWKSRCLKCQRIVKPRYSQLAYGIGGCKFCASHGYDFSSPGLIYLITHDQFLSHKIGISNVNAKEVRLDKHRNQGWRTFRTKEYFDGNVAYEVEQETLNWLRKDLGLSSYLSSEQMPQGGWTETVDASEIGLVTIWNKVLEFSRVKQ